MLIVPAQRCVIAGVDGSPNSIAALRRAATEAQQRHARLDVVRVITPGRTPGLVRTGTEWLRLRTLVAQTIPHAQHLTTRLKVEHGEPAKTLVKAAERAELLVIGAQERAERGSLFGGDTVPYVLGNAPCPVILCTGQETGKHRVS